MYLRRSFRLGLLPLFLFLLGSTFQLPNLSAQGLLLLDSIVQAHGLDPVPPISVLITGIVERNGKTEPFRMIATRDEELRLEYGTDGKDTLVVTQKLSFRDDGRKFTYPRVPSGFWQLDITGLFFVEQLRQRAVRVEVAGEPVPIAGVQTTRLVVQSERTQIHKGNVKVVDRADLYVGTGGLLTGISRSYYEGRPDAYTQSFLFSDFRKADDGRLLPYRIDLYVKGQRRQSFQIESYQFNVQAARDLFISRRLQ